MNPYIFTPLLLLMVHRAYTRRSLTTSGILCAIISALLHGIHPTPSPFLLLLSFYMMGTAATKVKHDIKSKITMSSTGGGEGGEGARTHVQVLANSLVASVLSVLHYAVLRAKGEEWCFNGGNKADFDILLVGVVANYAAVTADTLGSELGILATRKPIMITTLRECARGTNGGVTGWGLLCGAIGAGLIGAISIPLLGFCSWTAGEMVSWVSFITLVGTAGSLLDSLLGAVAQESVIDVRTGKIVEAPGGGKVLVHQGSPEKKGAGKMGLGKGAEMVMKDAGEKESRVVIAGWLGGILSNNGVNFTMALLTSLGAMVFWGGKEVVIGSIVQGVVALLRLVGL